MHQLSTRERHYIQFFHEQGYSIHQISRKMKCSRKTVRKWITQEEPEKVHGKKSKRGAKRKASVGQLVAIKKIALHEKMKGSRTLIGQINSVIGIEICHRTLRSYISSLGCRWGRPAKVPFLTERHKELRLKWALARVNALWRRWGMSDEKFFRAGAAPVGIRYEIGKRPMASVQRWAGQIMIWGMIHYTQGFIFHVVEGKLNGDTYKELLHEKLVPVYSPDMIFQQDNAPCHSCNKTKAWMKLNEIDYCIDWPPNSPDLNPIENLWGTLDFNVKQRMPKNKTELSRILQEELQKVSVKDAQDLINSMPERIEAVIKSKGGNFILNRDRIGRN